LIDGLSDAGITSFVDFNHLPCNRKTIGIVRSKIAKSFARDHDRT
jgi:hypothetical protein